MSAKLRDLLYFVALLILMAVFSHVLTPFAPMDFRVMAKFHDTKTVGDRTYRGRVYHLASQALTKEQKTVERWRGDLWNQQLLAENVYEPAPVVLDRVYDELGFPNKPGRDSYTIACLGDSQTAHSWPQDIEAALNVSTGNFGVPGLGPGYWRESLEAFVLPKKPKLVVIGLFNARNRVERIFYAGDVPTMPKSTLRLQIYWEKKYGVPLSLLESPFGRFGVIAIDRVKTARGVVKDLRPWWLFDKITPQKTRSIPTVIQLGATKHHFLPSPHSLPILYSPFREKYRRHIIQAITQIRGRCALEGIKTVIVAIPSKESVYLPFIQKELNEQEQLRLLGVLPSNLLGFKKHYNEPAKLAKEIAKDLELPFLDGSQVLSKAVQNGKHPWYVTDSHLSREGSVILGAEVARFIDSLGQSRLLSRSTVEMGAAPKLTVQKEFIELTVDAFKEGREIWLELDIEAFKVSDMLVSGAQGSLSIRPIAGRMRTTYFLRYDKLASEEDRSLKVSGMKRGTVIHGARLFIVQ
ncbi:MAG: hypothetical protein P1V97_11805 [Planctomycetota bacterium]|nr:hypothetical protein [Planctomycetota bacterium]